MTDENFYRDILKSSPYGYVYGELIEEKNNDYNEEDDKFIILDINSAFENMFNLKEKDILGKSLGDIVTGFIHYRFQWKNFFKAAKESKEKFSEDVFIDGLNQWFKIHITNYKDNYFVLRLVEIHKEKSLMNSIINNLPFSTWAKDKDGRYITVNKTYEEQSGYTFKEVRGKTDFQLWPKEIATEFIEEDIKAINSKDGKYVHEYFFNDTWYETHKCQVYDSKNNLMGTIGFSINIHNEKKAKSEVKEKDKFYKTLIDSIPDFIFYRDFNGVYQVANKAMAKEYFGRSFKDLIGKSHNEVVFDKSLLEALIFQDQEVLRENQIKIYEETLKLADGRVREYETVKIPYRDEDNNAYGVIGISRDITHRIEAERELERLRTEFFANLSHEFRTPLNLIFSSLQMVEFKLKSSVDESNIKVKKYVDIIKQNSYRLLRLINNLIDTTRLDAGYVEYNPINYDIVKFTNKICNSVAGFAGEKDIDLIFKTNLREKIIGFDLDKMERIILNLLSNAIKFNSPEGRIQVSMKSNKGFVEIEVKDNGIGIPKDKLADIFERFKQVNNRLTKISEGSGIGLSLVKSLVEIHGGTIAVESTLGRGSKFTIKLPDKLVKKEQEVSEAKSQLVGNTRVERIQIEFSDIYGINI